MNLDDPYESCLSKAGLLFGYYERARDPEALRMAIYICTESVKRRSAPRVERQVLSALLCVMQGALFAETGERNDVDLAIKWGRDSVKWADPDDPDLTRRLWHLGVMLQLRFETVVPACMRDSDEAVRLLGRVVVGTKSNESEYLRMHTDLAAALLVRWGQTRVTDDLDRAINVIRHALDAETQDDSELSRAFVILAELLQNRFRLPETVTRTDDLNRAVTWLERTAAATANDHPDYAGRWELLGLVRTVWLIEHPSTEPEDLDDLVAIWEQTLEATPPGHPDRAGCLVFLARALQSRYDYTGRRSDLESMVNIAREANNTVPADVAETPSAMVLSAALVRRFDVTGDRRDVEEAIALLRALVNTRPPHGFDPYDAMAMLSGALTQRFKCTGEFADLDEAVEILLPALAEPPSSAANHVGCMVSLSGALLRRFDRSSDKSDQVRATIAARRAVEIEPDSLHCIETLGCALMMSSEKKDYEEAVGLLGYVLAHTPDSMPFASGLLSNVGGAFCYRYEHGGNLDDLNKAIAIGERLVNSESGNVRQRAMFAANLGMAIRTRFERTGDSTDQRKVATLLGVATGIAGGSAYDRMRGAMNRALFSAKDGLWDQAADAYADALALVPDLADPQQRRESRERWLATLSDLARNAAACALHTGDLRRAVTLLEQGRGVLLAEVLTWQDDAVSRSRRDLADTQASPIVLLNLSGYRSDALILTEQGTQCVPLSMMTLPAVTSNMAKVWAASADPGEARADRLMFEVLDWLWEAVTGPVLHELGFLDAQDQPPRVWWIPTGILGFLPVHAAQRDGVGAMDFVASSYAPTIRTLKRRARRSHAKPRAMVVTMPETPGHRPLPKVAEELAVVAEHASDLRSLEGRQATREQVEKHLSNCEWAHFACHGIADILDPYSSCLLLHDHDVRPFTVADIAALQLKDAELAFLSACSTAMIGVDVPDEAIHIASAFQAAGFRHVVATLWPVRDGIAARLTSYFYRDLAINKSDPARALHNAQRSLREEFSDKPTLWAPYMHMGA